MTRVLLVDDEAIVRAGLRLILETEPDIEVVGECADGAAAVRSTSTLHPDVVLLDVQMPGVDGISATRRILESGSEARVVILTTFNHGPYVQEALRAGASGFLLKVAPPERLVEAVRVAARGEALLDPLVTRAVIEAFAALPSSGLSTAEAPGLAALTAREREVLLLLAEGRTNAEIAQEFVLGESTVKTHVARVLAKLHLRDRIQAVIYAYGHGLAGPERR